MNFGNIKKKFKLEVKVKENIKKISLIKKKTRQETRKNLNTLI